MSSNIDQHKMINISDEPYIYAVFVYNSMFVIQSNKWLFCDFNIVTNITVYLLLLFHRFNINFGTFIQEQENDHKEKCFFYFLFTYYNDQLINLKLPKTPEFIFNIRIEFLTQKYMNLICINIF